MSGLKSIRSRLTRFLESRLFPVYFLLSFLFFNKRVVKLHLLGRRSGFKGLNLEILKRRKRSDTLFILGSGGSINELSDETWKEIKSSDSLGFNFWLLHDHIPDFFMMEPPEYKENQDIMLEWVDKRKFQFVENDTAVLLKDFESGRMSLGEFPEELKANSQTLYKDSLYGNSIESKRRSLRYVRSLGLDRRNLLYFSRGSLFSTIYFGWKLGYRRIVLAGIDLYNSGYFYDSDVYKNKQRPVSELKGDVHDTVNKSISNVAMDDLVIMLNEELLKPDGCELYVLNASSLLYPRIPLHETHAHCEATATAYWTPGCSEARQVPVLLSADQYRTAPAPGAAQQGRESSHRRVR